MYGFVLELESRVAVIDQGQVPIVPEAEIVFATENVELALLESDRVALEISELVLLSGLTTLGLVKSIAELTAGSTAGLAELAVE
jgi:hypothetical protein